jgi:hypothetical protein
MWCPPVVGAIMCIISPSGSLCVRLGLVPGVVVMLLLLVSVRVSNVPLL